MVRKVNALFVPFTHDQIYSLHRFTQTLVRRCIYVDVCMYMHVYICMYVHVYVHVYVRVCMYIYMCVIFYILRHFSMIYVFYRYL